MPPNILLGNQFASGVTSELPHKIVSELIASEFRKGVFRKSVFQKVHFLEILENLIDLLMGLFRGHFHHGRRFPPLMGRFPEGLYEPLSPKISGKQPIKKRPIERFLIMGSLAKGFFCGKFRENSAENLRKFPKTRFSVVSRKCPIQTPKPRKTWRLWRL